MKLFFISLLKFYKMTLSPFLPRACIYTPTCSEYAMECLEKHGVLKGTWLALARIMRCNPLGRGGHDPVV